MIDPEVREPALPPEPPPVFSPRRGPSARLMHAQNKASVQIGAGFDHLSAPDEVGTASMLTGDTDPVRVGRVAAILAKHSEGNMDLPDTDSRLAATQLDWAKTRTAVQRGLVPPAIADKFSRLADIDDDEAANLSEFVRRVGDMTDSVYGEDLEFEPGVAISRIEQTLEGPAIHVAGEGKSMRSALTTVPQRLPFIAEGGDGAVVLSTGEVAVTGMPISMQAKVPHLEPALVRPDGVALWAPRRPLQVMDAEAWSRAVDNELDGHHVEKWTTQAFGGVHPAATPGHSILVDVAPGQGKKLGKIGQVVDPGEPAVVTAPDPDDPESRVGTRARRVLVRVAPSDDLRDAISQVGLAGGTVVAAYGDVGGLPGFAAATERHLNDGVIHTVVRHNAGPPGPGEYSVLLPEAVVAGLPTVAPGVPVATRSQGMVDFGVAIAPDGIVGKKNLSVAETPGGTPAIMEGDQAVWRDGGYVVKGDPADLLPAARAAQLLRQLGQKAEVEVEVDGKKVRLTGV